MKNKKKNNDKKEQKKHIAQLKWREKKEQTFHIKYAVLV